MEIRVLFKAFSFTAILSICSVPAAIAQESGPTPKVYGYLQFLAIIHEENSSGPDDGALAGFAERRARIGAKGSVADGFAGYNLMTEWAGASPAVVDFWGSVKPKEDFQILFGRFKPYLSAEMFSSGADLPNLERSPTGRLIAVYMFPLGSTRDLGLMAKYSLPHRLGALYISATNGLGSGPEAQVGGMAINKKNIRSKDSGGGMLCAGLALEPAEGFAISLSGAVNRIGSMTDAEGTSVRVERSSIAGGVKYTGSALGWLDAEYAAARREALDSDGPGEFSGYYLRAGAWLMADKLDLILRGSFMEQGAAAKTRDEDYSIALRYRQNGFEALTEYIKTGGAKGSFYGPKDPWALAVRLGVRF